MAQAVKHKTPKAVEIAAPDFTLRLAPAPAVADFRTPVKRVCITRHLVRPDHQGWSDHNLVVTLGEMPIDLAAPLLRSNLAALDTHALLAVIATTGEAHHRLIAQRPQLDWRVVKALLKSHHDSVLIAAVENSALDFDEEDEVRLARLAPDRPALLAAIRARPSLHVAIRHLDLPPYDTVSHDNLKLVKLLQACETERFVLEASRRLKLDPLELNRAVGVVSAVPLALLCCALGIDRAVFLAILPHWRTARPGLAVVNDAHRPVVLSVFTLSPEAAHHRLAALVG